MRFPGNCLVVALVAGLRPSNRVHMARNAWGRWHWYWTDSNGVSWRFYRPQSGRRSYLRNSLYIGEIKRVET